MAYPNLKGRKFGLWKVLDQVQHISHGLVYWWCHCKCGTTRPVYGSSLLRGVSTNCGCLLRKITAQRNRNDTVPLYKRFWPRVNKHGPWPSKQAVKVHPNIAGTRCWEWTGPLWDGYGRISGVAVHRTAWFLRTGRWPNPNALHKFDNRACVRFSHLFEGSNADNTKDKCIKGRVVKGEAVNTAKLTEVEVKSIRKALCKGMPGTHLATIHNVSNSTIYFIKRGETWKHIR